jgi:hypothetical protein
MTAKTTEELVDEMRVEREEQRAQGIAYFDGSPAWAEFCKQMGDAVKGGALKDDFDDE